MPFASKAQQRFLFSTHPAIARRFAEHTPDMSALPARAKAKKKKKHESTPDEKKAAFSDRAAAWCFHQGIPPQQAVQLLEKFATVLEVHAREKRAILGEETAAGAVDGAGKLVGMGLGALTNLGLAGTVGLPAAAGALGGLALGHLRNEADTADTESLRRMALARAYQRRAQEMALRRQVNQLQDKNPGRYVVLS